MFARIVLIASGVMFISFGLWALIAPVHLAALVHFDLMDSFARTEMRAFYGGLEIGFGLFLCISGLNSLSHRTALLSCACTLSGIAICRIIGIMIDGTAGSTFMIGALSLEVVGAVVSWFAWNKSPTITAANAA